MHSVIGHALKKKERETHTHSIKIHGNGIEKEWHSHASVTSLFIEANVQGF